MEMKRNTQDGSDCAGAGRAARGGGRYERAGNVWASDARMQIAADAPILLKYRRCDGRQLGVEHRRYLLAISFSYKNDDEVTYKYIFCNLDLGVQVVPQIPLL